MAQDTTPATAPAVKTDLSQLRAAAVPAVSPAETATEIGFYNGPSYALLRDIAKDFASSDIVPQRFQGKPANCMVAINMAARMQADPLMVMQNLYIVHGTPAWSAQFLISCFNQCGRFSSVQYRFIGDRSKDSWGCVAYATELKTGQVIEGAEVTIDIAKREGWYSKNGSKWQTMPQQMLMYRAAAWMIRTHAPEIGMGFQTSEEVIDMQPDAAGVFTVISKDIRPAEDGHGEEAAAENPQHAKTPAAKSESVKPAAKDTTQAPVTATAKPYRKCPEREGALVDTVDDATCNACKLRPDCPEWPAHGDK